MGQILVIFILLHFLSTIETSKKRYNFELYHLTCVNETDFIQSSKCELFELSKGTYAVNGHVMFARKMGKQFRISVWVDVRMKNSLKDVRFLDMTFNACEAWEQPLLNRILKSLLDEFKRSSNLPICCPFKQKFLYKINNYTANGDFLPTYTPFLTFTLTVKLYDRDTAVGLFKAVGATVPKVKQKI